MQNFLRDKILISTFAADNAGTDSVCRHRDSPDRQARNPYIQDV